MKNRPALLLGFLWFALIGCSSGEPEAAPNAPTAEAKSAVTRADASPLSAEAAATASRTSVSAQLRTIYREDADRDAPDVRVGGQARLPEAASTRTAEAVASDLEIRHEAAGAPAGTDALALRLRAHHTNDVPSAEELQAIVGAAAMLLWIEEGAQVLVERQRALTLLRHFYDVGDVRARLLARASDLDVFASVRVEALRSLAAVAPAHDDEAQAVLAAAATSDQARVRNAVAR